MLEDLQLPLNISEDEVKDNVQIVVMGADVLAYSYVREFNRAYGMTKIIVLASQDVKMLSDSKFTDYRIISDLYTEKGFYKALLDVAVAHRASDPNKVLMVLGCDDRHIRLLSKGKSMLEDAGYLVPYIDFDLLDRITQKHIFYDICDELDIPYPKTLYLSCNANDEVELPIDEFKYPLIMKPSNSAEFGFATIKGKRKVYEIESKGELLEVWENLRASDYDNEIVVQEFIPGGDDSLRSLTLFADSEGDVRVIMGGRVCLQDHNPTAIGNPVCILGEKDEYIIECAKKFIKHVGYHGFANFDIKIDSRDGSRRFFEVNTRCGRNTYQMSLGGVNFTTLFIRDFVLGETIEYQEAYAPFVYCCVPKYVLKKSIENKELLDVVLRTLAQTKDPYPLHYKFDSIAHNFWAELMFLNQIPKFKKYYWDTNGSQLKE